MCHVGIRGGEEKGERGESGAAFKRPKGTKKKWLDYLGKSSPGPWAGEFRRVGLMPAMRALKLVGTEGCMDIGGGCFFFPAAWLA